MNVDIRGAKFSIASEDQQSSSPVHITPKSVRSLNNPITSVP